MPGNHICDVPGCGASRARWQRLCDACFRKLPGELRVGIKEAKHQRRQKDWNDARRRAAAFLGFRNDDGTLTIAAIAKVPPERAYELQQRMLGERPD